MRTKELSNKRGMSLKMNLFTRATDFGAVLALPEYLQIRFFSEKWYKRKDTCKEKRPSQQFCSHSFEESLDIPGKRGEMDVLRMVGTLQKANAAIFLLNIFIVQTFSTFLPHRFPGIVFFLDLCRSAACTASFSAGCRGECCCWCLCFVAAVDKRPPSQQSQNHSQLS